MAVYDLASCHINERVTRIDGFSAVVLALRTDCCRVAGGPSTYGELIHSLQGFVPFSICFAFLIEIWYYYYHFFRRYGLEDVRIVMLNSSLLFVVLLFVYHLKSIHPRFRTREFRIAYCSSGTDVAHHLWHWSHGGLAHLRTDVSRRVCSNHPGGWRFCRSTVSWEVIGWHEKRKISFQNQDEVSAVIASHAPRDGSYIRPGQPPDEGRTVEQKKVL